MTPTIRAAQVNDGEAMRQCGLQALPAEPQPIEYFTRTLSTCPGLSYVAIDDEDKVVGICLVRLKEDVKDAVHAHVGRLCVHPNYQGQGIGRALLTASLRSAKLLFGISEVTLHARKSNAPAIGLYTSLKFYTTQTKPGFYYDGEDALAMSILLEDDVNA